jgi:hypothetical protein
MPDDIREYPEADFIEPDLVDRCRETCQRRSVVQLADRRRDPVAFAQIGQAVRTEEDQPVPDGITLD